MLSSSTPTAQNDWRPHLKALPANVITPAKNGRGLARSAGIVERREPDRWPAAQRRARHRSRSDGHSRLESGRAGGSVVIDPPNGRIPYNAKATDQAEREPREGVFMPTKRFASRSGSALPARRCAPRHASGHRDSLRAAVRRVRLDRPHLGPLVHTDHPDGRPSLPTTTQVVEG